MILAQSITKSYGDLKVLKGIDFQINKGEIVSIIGASGAGKTTLLQILGTLLKPDSGLIRLNGIDVSLLNEKQLSKFRNQNIGFVFQFHHLLPEFTALENVCIPSFIAKKNEKETIHKATEILSFLNLSSRLYHKPSELSGGERQRVAIARALINNPAVIFADEPSGNLDSQNARELYDLFLTLRQKWEQTFVIVTHNAELSHLSDRTLTMKDGRIE